MGAGFDNVERKNNGVEMGEVGICREMLWKFNWLGHRVYTASFQRGCSPTKLLEQNNSALGGVGLKVKT